jgi:hypothetical protein
MSKDQMSEEPQGGYRLTDEQAAEVRRRLARENPVHVPLDEARLRFIAPKRDLQSQLTEKKCKPSN